MSNPEDTKTMRSLIEAANSITNPTTLVRHPWLTEEEVGEAIAEAKHVGNRPTTGVPAGASKEDHEKARKANPFRARLGKGVPAGAGAKKEEVEEEDELDEGAVKSAIEDFIYDLPKEAIEELKVIMKEKYGSSRTNKLIKIRGKYKLPTQVMGYPTVQLINDYFNTYFGAVNEAVTPPDLILKAAVSTARLAGEAATNLSSLAHAAFLSTVEAQRVGSDDDSDLEALDAAKDTMEYAKTVLKKTVEAYEAAVKAYSHR